MIGIYDSKDHDQHHSLFNLNYGFPNPYLDIIHGTYNGNFLGFTITPRKKR
jgi:sterol desaturase/sphingolipid hydroxylase (fatty acid hydroxylase superfamily)